MLSVSQLPVSMFVHVVVFQHLPSDKQDPLLLLFVSYKNRSLWWYQKDTLTYMFLNDWLSQSLMQSVSKETHHGTTWKRKCPNLCLMLIYTGQLLRYTYFSRHPFGTTIGPNFMSVKFVKCVVHACIFAFFRPGLMTAVNIRFGLLYNVPLRMGMKGGASSLNMFCVIWLKCHVREPLL